MRSLCAGCSADAASRGAEWGAASAAYQVEGAYQVEDEKERLNEAISLIWKWKLVIGLICMSAGAGLALAERRRKEENIKKNMERNDKGKEE